jgi:hypothetical protein
LRRRSPLAIRTISGSISVWLLRPSTLMPVARLRSLPALSFSTRRAFIRETRQRSVASSCDWDRCCPSGRRRSPSTRARRAGSALGNESAQLRQHALSSPVSVSRLIGMRSHVVEFPLIFTAVATVSVYQCMYQVYQVYQTSQCLRGQSIEHTPFSISASSISAYTVVAARRGTSPSLTSAQ